MMKYLITILSALLILFPAVAQQLDTTSTVVGNKLDFESPNFVAKDYFEEVKSHLSAEGRKNWKPEFSVRVQGMIYYLSVDLTGGIRTSPNKVFGLGVSHGKLYYDANPADAYRWNFYLYHRHYIPLDRRRRISLYSDLMVGGAYTYKVTGYIENDNPKVNSLNWYFSWEPGLSIRLWGKSNIFLGPSFGPTIGLHLGLAI